MSILNQPFRLPPSCFRLQINDETPRDEFWTQQRPHQEKITLTSAEREKKDEIDALLTEAMNALTFEERQEQQETLHGVDDGLKEETHFVDSAMKDLENYLVLIKNGSMYETAEQMNPDYVHSKAFRLMFLRGNRYDTKASAEQMIKYFQAKEQLFGREKLTKDITIEDLHEDDLRPLKSGSIQVAGKDRSSRQIVFQIPGLRSYKTMLNELRARYYIIMQLLKSEEVQLKGAVGITYAVGDFMDKMKGDGFLDHMKLSVALPIHIASFHACGSDVTAHLLANLAVRAMPAKLRARFRMHTASHMETLYILSTYGISSDQVPLNPWSYEVDMTRHLKWVEDRLKEVCCDSSNTTPDQPLALEPKPNDVLYIKGRKTNNLGNIRLRTLVRELVSVYATVPNEKKRFVVDRMINEIHKTGGRFLQESNGSWFEMPIEKVKPKITQSFRNFKSKREACSRPKPAIIGTRITGEPSAQDVIFGRSQRSRGNDLLTRLVKDYSKEYNALDRGKKHIVVDTVVQQIKAQGGRFLQPTEDYNGGWLELPDDVIRDKVSRHFRNIRRPSKKTSAQ